MSKFILFLFGALLVCGNAKANDVVGKQLSCPAGYIGVPAMLPYTSKDFCVSKYEMKNVDGYPISHPDGLPWVNVTRNEARLICKSLGDGYSLISNAQWQTIARNIEQVGANWSGGQPGAGQLNRGHSDLSPPFALPAGLSDSLGCFGTGEECSKTEWNLQKRTHLLSNGEVIWDFAGNVSEWLIDDPRTFGNFSPVRELNDCATFTDYYHRELFCSSDHTLGRIHGIGVVFQAPTDALVRGGAWWNDGFEEAGVFFTLPLWSMEVSRDIGFRCVWSP